MVGPADKIRAQHSRKLPQDAGTDLSLHRCYQAQPPAACGAGKHDGGAAETEVPGKSDSGKDRTEVSDGSLSSAVRRETERDHQQESCPDDRPAVAAAHRPTHPDDRRGAEIVGRTGKRAAALPAVLSALHVHRLPPRRAVRPALVGLYLHRKWPASHRQSLPQQRPRQGHRRGNTQEWQKPRNLSFL